MVISIEKVSNEKLEKISGGGIEWFGIGMGIATIVVFISGIIAGHSVGSSIRRMSDKELCPLK